MLPAPGSMALAACVEGPQHCISPPGRARRAAKEAKEAPAQPAPEKVKVEVKKFVKIGRPGYKGKGAPAPSHADYCSPQSSLAHTHSSTLLGRLCSLPIRKVPLGTRGAADPGEALISNLGAAIPPPEEKGGREG